MDNKTIQNWFEKRQQPMVDDICALIRIDSVRRPAQPGKPFGPGAADALAAAQRMAEGYGLAVKNYDNYALGIDLNDRPTKLAILAHLDVVEPGSGWTQQPFSPAVRDDCIFGRGTADDKGPAVAALYALRCVKELCPDLPYNVRLILGSAEETGSEDLRYYFTKETAPEMSFSPDGEYPVINLEKGAFGPAFGKTWPTCEALPRVSSVVGGHTNNIVPREASARVVGLSAQAVAPVAAAYEQKTGVRFTLTEADGAVCIAACGISAHASTPEKGNNAQTALLALLSALPLADCPATAAVRELVRLFPHGETDGASVGVKQADEISGALTLNFGVLELGETGYTARFDSRVPVCGNEANVIEPVRAAFAECGIEFSSPVGLKKPHCTPADSPLVRTLLAVYERNTGLPGTCLAIGGGTYVHDIEGGVAFGCALPGVDNRMHGADEFVRIPDLTLSGRMFAEAIGLLCR